ncbi:methylthioribulose 1-phosphate dehydratase [Blastomonas sp.]|uniref:methylthioribulose 1-phosphate dehydratase n=1 Tax=Blastomonas sp. TaxID=1909299 RepID=UPI0035932FB5
MQSRAFAPNLADACDALIALGGRLDARGLAAATSGNHSARIDDGSILITRSGQHKGRMDMGSFMRIDADGHALDSGQPSAETALHLMLYRHCDAGAVLHCHSPQAVGFSRVLAGETHVQFEGHEMLKAFPGITSHDVTLALPLVDNSQNMADIEAVIAPQLGRPGMIPAFLIRSHGVYAWGADVAEAERVLEAVEWLIAATLVERGNAITR